MSYEWCLSNDGFIAKGVSSPRERERARVLGMSHFVDERRVGELNGDDIAKGQFPLKSQKVTTNRRTNGHTFIYIYIYIYR